MLKTLLINQTEEQGVQVGNELLANEFLKNNQTQTSNLT